MLKWGSPPPPSSPPLSSHTKASLCGMYRPAAAAAAAGPRLIHESNTNPAYIKLGPLPACPTSPFSFFVRLCIYFRSFPVRMNMSLNRHSLLSFPSVAPCHPFPGGGTFPSHRVFLGPPPYVDLGKSAKKMLRRRRIPSLFRTKFGELGNSMRYRGYMRFSCRSSPNL